LVNSCSEIRLNEALENACTNVLDYKMHKDKIKALRYEKSMYEQPSVFKASDLQRKAAAITRTDGSSKALDADLE